MTRTLIDSPATYDPGTLAATINAAMSEREFANLVVQLAQIKGWKVYRTWNSLHSPAGYPDLTMARGTREGETVGRLLFIELKKESGKLTTAQRDWLAALLVAGAEARIWRPSMWNDIVEELSR